MQPLMWLSTFDGETANQLLTNITIIYQHRNLHKPLTITGDDYILILMVCPPSQWSTLPPTHPLSEFLEDFDGQIFSLFVSDIPSLRDIASPGEYYQEHFNKLSEDERVMATRGMIVDFAML